MERQYNKIGIYCYQDCILCSKFHICEHNLFDASINPMNACAGTEIECINGSRFSCGPSNRNILSM